MSRRIYAIAASVVADAVRRKVIYVVLLFAAVMAAAIPMLPSYGVGVVQSVYREVALSLTYVAAMVVVLALSANRIPGEVERRTIYNVLSRSVRRWEYVLGTWLGITATIGAVLVAFGVVVFAFGLVVYQEPMWQLWQGILAVWFEASVIAAFCMAISAVSGPVVVATAALAFLFVAHARSGLLTPSQFAWHLYPSLDTFNIINPVAHGSGVRSVYVLIMLGVFAAWASGLLLVSSALFARRDL